MARKHKKQARSKTEKSEEEIRAWGRREPSSKPGRAVMWNPGDTKTNVENTPMDPPDTEYDAWGGTIQDKLLDKDK